MNLKKFSEINSKLMLKFKYRNILLKVKAQTYGLIEYKTDKYLLILGIENFGIKCFLFEINIFIENKFQKFLILRGKQKSIN